MPARVASSRCVCWSSVQSHVASVATIFFNLIPKFGKGSLVTYGTAHDGVRNLLRATLCEIVAMAAVQAVRTFNGSLEST